jgi:hypothetical protein
MMKNKGHVSELGRYMSDDVFIESLLIVGFFLLLDFAAI